MMWDTGTMLYVYAVLLALLTGIVVGGIPPCTFRQLISSNKAETVKFRVPYLRLGKLVRTIRMLSDKLYQGTEETAEAFRSAITIIKNDLRQCELVGPMDVGGKDLDDEEVLKVVATDSAELADLAEKFDTYAFETFTNVQNQLYALGGHVIILVWALQTYDPRLRDEKGDTAFIHEGIAKTTKDCVHCLTKLGYDKTASEATLEEMKKAMEHEKKVWPILVNFLTHNENGV